MKWWEWHLKQVKDDGKELLDLFMIILPSLQGLSLVTAIVEHHLFKR